MRVLLADVHSFPFADDLGQRIYLVVLVDWVLRLAEVVGDLLLHVFRMLDDCNLQLVVLADRARLRSCRLLHGVFGLAEQIHVRVLAQSDAIALALRYGTHHRPLIVLLDRDLFVYLLADSVLCRIKNITNVRLLLLESIRSRWPHDHLHVVFFLSLQSGRARKRMGQSRGLLQVEDVVRARVLLRLGVVGGVRHVYLLAVVHVYELGHRVCGTWRLGAASAEPYVIL